MDERGFWLQALIVGTCILVWLTLIGSVVAGVTIGLATRSLASQFSSSPASPTLDYSAGQAQDADARANVRSIIPSIESYYADNDSYSGMTLAGLQATYDQALDPSQYTLSGVTATTYCVSSGTAPNDWKKEGPAAPILQGTC